MKNKVQELLVEAMKKGDKLKVSVYRSLKADIETAEKNGNCNVMEILAKAYKKRMESVDAYLKGGKQAAASEEADEATIIKELLPKEPTEKEVMDCIRECASNISAKMGDIIKYVKSEYPSIDGKILAQKVKEFLSDK